MLDRIDRRSYGREATNQRADYEAQLFAGGESRD